MGKINVLGFDVANLIAAGEVVERPASVLKELIENSIDAGATKIVAEIKRGGVSLIRVTDNGCGIDKDDLPLSLQRHATSKIKTKEDLDGIVTLGFRGEALAAISSVSTITIITKPKDQDTAYMLTAEAGKVVDLDEVGASDGTTVVVSELFYNVPARRKFLKKDATEAMNVSALVERVALSRPEISIQLLIDGNERFKTPGDGNLYNTIYSIYGKDFAGKLIEVYGEANGVTTRGFIGRSDNVKKNRNLMNVFINGRYVKSLTVQAAIERAYTSYIAPECFPSCVLFIDINPSLVDVNVHPAKLEVKFADEREVFEAVYYTVKTGLENHEYRPELELSKKKSEAEILNPFVALGEDTRGTQLRADIQTNERRYQLSGNENPYIYHPSISTSIKTESTDKPINFKSEARFGTMSARESIDLLKKYSGVERSVTEKEVIRENTPRIDYKLLGEAFNCYVMVEYENALLIIDKHAAHERVIFEDLKAKRAHDGRIASQVLLLPITVILGPVELDAARQYKSEIEAIGFRLSESNGAVNLTAVPEAISAIEAENLFVNIIDEIVAGEADPKLTDSIRRERALYQVACKAAIKGGRIYDKAILEWLIEKVLSLPDITVCPHGRPIAYKLKKSELDRQFDRIK